MKTVWINKVRIWGVKSGYKILSLEIPTMKPLDWGSRNTVTNSRHRASDFNTTYEHFWERLWEVLFSFFLESYWFYRPDEYNGINASKRALWNKRVAKAWPIWAYAFPPPERSNALSPPHGSGGYLRKMRNGGKWCKFGTAFVQTPIICRKAWL